MNGSDQLQQFVSRLNTLVPQHRTYAGLLPLFAHNPRIVSFNITADLPPSADDKDSVDEPVSIALPVTVSADGISYPPQMLEAIKAQVEQRLKQINEQLNELGVAAASLPPAASPAAQPAPAPHKPNTPKHEPPKPPPRTTRR